MDVIGVATDLARLGRYIQNGFGQKCLCDENSAHAAEMLWGLSMFRGEVVSIHIAAKAGIPMDSPRSAKAVVARGLEGDRYFDGAGYWSNHPHVGREITLIEIESIEALEKEKNITVEPAAARRNIVTRGVPLNHLVGREFRVGAVRLRGKRLCEPCDYLEGLTVKGVLTGLIHRGGLRADIILGGTISVGDEIVELSQEHIETSQKPALSAQAHD